MDGVTGFEAVSEHDDLNNNQEPQDDDLLAWQEIMRYRSVSRDTPSTPTDLDGCSISAKASSSPDRRESGSQFAYEDFQFVDSATDSGQTSDNDSRHFALNQQPRTTNARKLLIENLLHEIYGPDQSYIEDLQETRNVVRRTSDASLTSASRRKSVVDYTAWRLHMYSELSQTLQSLGYQGTDRLDVTVLQGMDNGALKNLVTAYEKTILPVNQYLVAELKRKDYRQICQSKHCLIVSAALQVLAPNPSGEVKIRFSVTPPPGDGYFQWIDAMRSVLKLPGGLPTAFRKTMWLTVANRYISELPFEWDKVKKLLLHDRFNPDEEALGIQIVKDLHRTGCSGFCGEHNERERYLLKRVLTAYARFRPSVGYCQGFNIIAAVILDVVDKDEEDALKIMIYLIEHVLPGDYFANDLEALFIDLSVFQELIGSYMPELSTHLDQLRKQSVEERGANGGDEPPLTNLFTIQWFLTLFATCLPQEATLRVWDCVFLYGSVIIMKTSLALLRKLEKYFLPMDTAFDFYSIMSELQQRMLDSALFGPEEIIQEIFSVPEFDLRALREKHAVIISSGSQPSLKAFRRLHSEKSGVVSGLFTGLPRLSPRRLLSGQEQLQRRSSAADAETDIANLKKKYDDYTRERRDSKSSNVVVGSLGTLTQRSAGRRGTIFLQARDVPVNGNGEQHVKNPFIFPAVFSDNVCAVGDNYLETALSASPVHENRVFGQVTLRSSKSS